MINVTNMDNGGSDNSDTFAGYLTYGTNNPSPEVHVASSPGHQVLTSTSASNLSAQQVSPKQNLAWDSNPDFEAPLTQENEA